MTPGQRVLGRFLLEEALPSPPGQLRWSAHDDATGERVEVVAPTARVALRPDSAAHFAGAQQRPRAHPALLPVIAAGDTNGRPVASRPLLRGPVDPELRLDAEQAAQWAAWLGPAALAAAPALAGELGPADLVIDHDDILRLSPAGLVPARSEVLPPRFRAPETLRDGQILPGSALYGLGVLLYRGLTGAWPVEASSAAALAAAPPPRAIRTVLPDLPTATCDLVDGLLSPDPAARVALLATLPQAAPVSSDAVLEAAAGALHGGGRQGAGTTLLSPPGVQTTRDAPAPRRARPDWEHQAWAVVVEGAGLTDAARRRAAALLDLPPTQVQELADAGLPLPVAEASTRQAAQDRAASLAAQGLPAVVRSGEGAAGPARSALLAGGGAATSGLFALLSLIASGLLGLVAVPLVAVFAVSSVLLAALGLRSGQEARSRRRLAEARGRLGSAPGVDQGGPVDALAARLRGVRRDILAADLASPLRIDLEGAAGEIEVELDRLARLWDQPAEQEVVSAELDALEPLVDQLAAAVHSHLRGASASPALHDDVRRRTAAARAAAAELSGRRR